VVNGQMNQKSVDRPIKNEGQNGLKNLRGTIAMARTADLDSATSQFFINVVDNAVLDYPNNGGYAVFGKVVEGMDVVDKIKAGKTVTDPRGEPSVPVETRRDPVGRHRVSVDSGFHHSFRCNSGSVRCSHFYWAPSHSG
jgi:cyclophilin family peptidyl-prolyl cis-trans isomerase